jgi:hypothetical protein
MTPLNLSFVLFLTLFPLLNAESPSANGNEKRETRNSHPGDRTHQQKPPNSNTNPQDPSPIKQNEQPHATIEKEDPKDEWKKVNVPECSFMPTGLSGSCADWGMFLATLGAIFVGLRTLIALKRQVDANYMAAEAALKTAESLITIERAYVFAKVEAQHVNEHGNGGITITAQIQFWNYGKTPAIPIRVQWTGQETAMIPQNLAGADRDVPYWHEGITIAPGRAISVHHALGITPDGLIGIRTGSRTVYVWGRLEYRDVFNNAHETGFCWEYRPISDPPSFECTRESSLNKRT